MYCMLFGPMLALFRQKHERYPLRPGLDVMTQGVRLASVPGNRPQS